MLVLLPLHRQWGAHLHADIYRPERLGQHTTLPGSKAASSELSVGVPGMALIPPKLVQNILRGGFIDMYKLLPETWRAEEPKESCCRSTRLKRGLVTDITLWTECYALLAAVLAMKHPDKTPHFMGYLRTIVRASRNFEGAAWATYDAAYRRQAANRQSLDWAPNHIQ